MKISKSYLKLNSEYPSSVMEITDRELSQGYRQYPASRSCRNSLLPLESQSHRNYGKINHNFLTVPKRCQIAGDRYSEQAFSVLQYQLQDREAKQTHINNLKLNLERRLKSAKAQGNERLVALLTQESFEITS